MGCFGPRLRGTERGVAAQRRVGAASDARAGQRKMKAVAREVRCWCSSELKHSTLSEAVRKERVASSPDSAAVASSKPNDSHSKAVKISLVVLGSTTNETKTARDSA